jgi:hypothetical protein
MVLLMRSFAIAPVSTFNQIICLLILGVELVPSDGLPWTPKPLRTWFWVTYVCVLVAVAIALEVSLHYSHKKGGTSSILGVDNNTRLLILHTGWPTPTNVEKSVLHYVYVRPFLDE